LLSAVRWDSDVTVVATMLVRYVISAQSKRV
jgi:hypothetical protein